MMKKKSFITLILAGALALSACFAMVGCAPDGTPTPITKTIASKADFVALQNYTGEKYAGSVFTLSADLDFSGEKYVPIGTLASPFMATLDGAGHKLAGISFLDEGLLPEMTGVVGAAKNAEFRNLTVEMSIHQKITKKGNYLGAIVGASWGTLAVDQVNVTLDLNNSYETYHYKNPVNDVEETRTDAVEYAGGVVGYVNGQFKISNAKVDIRADETLVEDNEAGTGIPRNAIFLGGIVGYGSGSGAQSSYIRQSSATLNNFSAAAVTVYAGGIAGYLMRAEVDGCLASFPLSANEMRFRNVGLAGKGSVGGLLGYAYQCKLQNLEFSSPSPQKIIWISTPTYGMQPLTFGGVVGYCENSDLKDSKTIFSVNVYGGNYFGGIAGAARGGTIKNVVATGSGDLGVGFIYQKDLILQYLTNGSLRICQAVAMVKGNVLIEDCSVPVPAEGRYGTVFVEQDVDKDGNAVGAPRVPKENGKPIIV